MAIIDKTENNKNDIKQGNDIEQFVYLIVFWFSASVLLNPIYLFIGTVNSLAVRRRKISQSVFTAWIHLWNICLIDSAFEPVLINNNKKNIKTHLNSFPPERLDPKSIKIKQNIIGFFLLSYSTSHPKYFKLQMPE